MRAHLTTAMLSLTLALPLFGTSSIRAQNIQLESWQIDGSPVFFEGDYYCASGPTVYYDEKIMVPSGRFGGVVLYVDTTMEANSVVYAPVGGRLLRPYERPRTGDKAGTTGSRTPSFPVALSAARPPSDDPADRAAACGRLATVPQRTFTEIARPVQKPEDLDIETGFRVEPPPQTVRSAALPQGNPGVWISFNGGRWSVSGPAVDFVAASFTQIGTYEGAPVYQRRQYGSAWEIFIPSRVSGRLTHLVKIDQ